jgi:hypothetical protein
VNPRDILEQLPDDALLPVAYIRQLLAQSAAHDPEPLADLSVQDVAQALGRKPSPIRAWCASGRLEGYKLNSREWRIGRSALRAYQDQQRQNPIHNEKSFRTGREVDLAAWRKVRREAAT